MSDNWQHRAKGMRCDTCMWFNPKGGDLGRCRRRAPTLDGWPAVYVSDWCGDHKLDETKIKPTIEEQLKASLKMTHMPTPIPSPFNQTIVKAKEAEL